MKVAGGARGVVVWDLDQDRLPDAACRLAGRDLTRTEWRTHLRDLGPYRPSCPELDTSGAEATPRG